MSPLPKLRILITAVALSIAAPAHAAHYQVILLAGQSNMTGNGPKTSDLTEAQQAPQDDVWIYGGTDESASKLGPLQPGFGSPYGPEISFGRTIADGRPHENFALIKYSKGGTHLYGDWDPATGYAYNRLKTTVGFGLEALTKAGHSYEVVGMLWTQGERDAANGRTTAEYEADLNEFIADIRTRYGADLAFFISRLSVLQTGRPIAEVRAAQDNVAAADPKAYLIDTDSFDMAGDNIHFTGTGLVALGHAFGQAYLNSLPVDASAPQIDTLSPVHTAPAVEPTANLSMTFDEAVVFGTGDITLRQAGGSLVESYDVAAPSTNLILSGNTLTIDPSSLLAPSTGYYIEIAATAIVDHSGNPFAGISGDGTWSFTTSAADNTLPGISSLSPTNVASNVHFNSDLTITFTENVAFGSGNITLRQTGGALVESYDVASPPANLSISGGTLTINPTNDLLPSAGYYLEIDAAAIDDHAGNSFAGLDSSVAWAFATAAPVIDGSEITATASRTDYNSNGTARGTPDKTIDGSGLNEGEHGSAVGTYCLAPTTIYNPVENQWFQWDLGASHTLGSIHVWNFDLRSVDIYFSNVAIPGGTGSGNWTRLGGAALELPAPGAPNTGFDLATATGTTLPNTEVRHIRFKANAIWSGNGVAVSEIQFSASPAPEDESPPEIQTLSPAHTATGVALASNLSVTFNEDIAFGTGAIRLRRQSDDSIIQSFDVASPPVGLTLSGGTVTLNPTADLASATTYYVEIDATAIDDLAGNSFDGFSGEGTWSFTISNSATTAAISPVGTQYNLETKDNDPTVGWRRTTTAKTLDIDGDNVVGTDGYRTSNRGANPTYATATVVAPNTNNFSRIDDPNSTTADVSTGTLHDNNAGLGVETVPLLQFVITGAIPVGETLRVGVLFDGVGSANGTNSATYTLKQTVGGSATATTPALFYQDGGLDVTYFDLTDLNVGDTFVVTSTSSATNSEFSNSFEQVIGITFDTGVISSPGETFADWIGGYTGLNGLTAFGDDADGDRIENGIENYFGTHPSEFSQGLVTGTVTGSTMTFTHPLNDTPASNLTATYRWSKDLSSFHADGETFEGTTVSFSQSTPAADMVTATATITGTALDRLFVDIEVTMN